MHLISKLLEDSRTKYLFSGNKFAFHYIDIKAVYDGCIRSGRYSNVFTSCNFLMDNCFGISALLSILCMKCESIDEIQRFAELLKLVHSGHFNVENDFQNLKQLRQVVLPESFLLPRLFSTGKRIILSTMKLSVLMNGKTRIIFIIILKIKSRF